MSKKQYKIHVAYINTNGTIVPAGIYGEGSFDLAEARHKSIVTTADVTVENTVKAEGDMPVHKFNNDSTEIIPIEVTTTMETIKLEKVKINSVDVEKLQELKYISKPIALKVVSEREHQRFVSYPDLNSRVPLRFNRVWEDIAAVDFEEIVGQTTENSIYYSDGTVPL